jgi:hypothetical protein
MATIASISRGENVDELHSLNSQVERLSATVDFWNSAIIVMMIIAALAATGLLITQYIAL